VFGSDILLELRTGTSLLPRNHIFVQSFSLRNACNLVTERFALLSLYRTHKMYYKFLFILYFERILFASKKPRDRPAVKTTALFLHKLTVDTVSAVLSKTSLPSL
jgi:hypothetical protein